MQAGLPDHARHERLPTRLTSGDIAGEFSPRAVGLDHRSHSRRITTKGETTGFESYKSLRVSLAIFLEAIFNF
jgi:hypothetical protein